MRKTLIGLAVVALSIAQVNAGPLARGSMQALMAQKEDCRHMGEIAEAGYHAKQQQKNINTVMFQLTGPYDTWRLLEMDAANYGYDKASNQRSSFEYAFSKCWDNWERLVRDGGNTPWSELK